jgi:catechol 2,3-dioxygenase-like lactoylglutathione lyase family enzyme
MPSEVPTATSASTPFRDPQINLYVREIEPVLRFYRDHLGFVETFRTPRTGEPIHVELRLGGLVLGLARRSAIPDVHGFTPGDGPPRSEVVVWTPDVDAAYAILTAAGAKTLSAPHDFLGRLRAAWVLDPEGNPVQIVMDRSSGG